MFTTVIFDLDDTLYPESEYVHSCFMSVSSLISRKYKIDESIIYQTLMATFERGIRGRNFNVTLDELNLPYDELFIMQLVEHYRDHTPNIHLPECTKKVLEALKNKVKLGILTDGYYKSQKLKIEALGLAATADGIEYTDRWGRENWKPNKKGYVNITKILGEVPEKCCYVGDNPEKDFKGAKECGMYCIQTVEWVKRGYESLSIEYHPDLVIQRIDELMKYIW
ncbi:MAG: HAD family hydrolase [Actinobacteria bacterium]|nr:HAD family hydrolase [Actinomycetota bacterium]